MKAKSEYDNDKNNKDEIGGGKDDTQDCTKNFVRFHDEYIRKNGVNPAHFDLYRAHALNGVNNEKLPKPVV